MRPVELDFSGSNLSSPDVPKLPASELVSRLRASLELMSERDYTGACAVLSAPAPMSPSTSVPGMGEN